MGADVVDGGVLIVDEEDGDESALDAEGAAFAGGDVADFGDGFELGHRDFRMDPANCEGAVFLEGMLKEEDSHFGGSSARKRERR